MNSNPILLKLTCVLVLTVVVSAHAEEKGRPPAKSGMPRRRQHIQQRKAGFKKLTVGLLVNVLADRDEEWVRLPRIFQRLNRNASHSHAIRCIKNKCTSGGGDEEEDGLMSTYVYACCRAAVGLVVRCEGPYLVTRIHCTEGELNTNSNAVHTAGRYKYVMGI